MSKKDDMLNLWFEETVMPHLDRYHALFNAEDFTASFRDYFSVELRDELPPHEISERLQEIARKPPICGADLGVGGICQRQHGTHTHY